MRFTVTRYAVLIALVALQILASYSVYFRFQRWLSTPGRNLVSALDKWFSYDPRWVWVYTVVYYLGFFSVIPTVVSLRQYAILASSYVLLLAGQLLIFLRYPVETPEEWRVRSASGPSEALLMLVQRFDRRSTCFPSFHMSAATLTACHLSASSMQVAPLAIGYAIAVGFSALFTKQHCVWDVIAGVAMGILVFAGFTVYSAALGCYS